MTRSHEPVPSGPIGTNTSPAPGSPAPDEDNDSGTGSPELPLTMNASVMLADLPRDATAALASVGGFAQEKVVVKFKPVGAAPSLAQELCKISATRKFEEVVRYLRRKLRCKDTDSVFLYVNSAFAPSLDEVVGNLHQCFKNGQDQLVVAYSMTPAFG
ncbi:Autophagy-related protein 12 [Metarhizium rileyi]|uniref:Ubiquitin-like protein ATG12 n=1 Tax=Metarhizium rileyi (strain RCEF 4871) TaxID=1649241 RepID=A0A162M6I5_METRR|nr:Autophagy-related protein 12 [Metarhizium rileyi RCEF 4871]TWU73018.1 Ubiquitin-like protein [Metarhizium rileyi]